MSNELIRFQVSDTHTLYIPANRLRITDFQVEGDIWSYRVTIGNPIDEDEL